MSAKTIENDFHPLAFAYDFIETLGKRGPDGMPLGAKVLDGVAKIALGLSLKDPILQSAITVNAALKPAIALIGCLTAPITGLSEVVCSVKAAIKAMSGQIEANKKVIIKVYNEPKASPVKTYTCNTKEQIEDDSGFKTAEVFLEAIRSVSSYASSITEATVKMCELNALNLSSELLYKVSLVGSACSTVFACVSVVGATSRLVLTFADWIKPGGDVKFEEHELSQALAQFAKAAIKVAVVVFAGYFSLAIQGVATLAVVAIDIYLLKTRDNVISKKELHFLATPALDTMPAAVAAS